MNPVESGGPALSLKRRRPAPAPQANGVVFFLHPGYPDSKNVLLSLPALDSGGIHHETARIACAILADCNWNGFFSLTRDGPRLPAGSDDILTQNRYYFRIEGGMSNIINVFVFATWFANVQLPQMTSTRSSRRSITFAVLPLSRLHGPTTLLLQSRLRSPTMLVNATRPAELQGL